MHNNMRLVGSQRLEVRYWSHCNVDVDQFEETYMYYLRLPVEMPGSACDNS